ncbi:MAG: hypothetical protein OEU86_09970, partial [Gammaproteobacteria bacterium]|nr:hypothetical protein [Gammaproteobacteria bacterium]
MEKGSPAHRPATTCKYPEVIFCASLLLALLPYQHLAAQDVAEPVEEEAVVTETQDVPEPEAESDEADQSTERSNELAEKLDRRQQEAEIQNRSERRGELYYESEAVVEAAPQSQADVQQDDVDILDIDVSDSIDTAVEKEGYLKYGGDIRVAYNWADQKFRNGDSDRDDDITGRLRFESQFNPTDNFRVTGRLAWRCSTTGCDPNIDWAGDEDGGSVEPGTLTIDELFVHWFRTDRFNVAMGRMQTRAITRGGVFANSLDRSNSSGTSVTYTDGVYVTYRPSRLEGWTVRFISEYNDEDGATTTRREPLDFSTSDSKISHYIGFGNNNPSDLFVQRDFGITYLPDALLVEGDENGKRDDYWGFVGRTAMRIPLGEGLRRLQLAGEVGYAPDTPE